jgi:hypothetical protein
VLRRGRRYGRTLYTNTRSLLVLFFLTSEPSNWEAPLVFVANAFQMSPLRTKTHRSNVERAVLEVQSRTSILAPARTP